MFGKSPVKPWVRLQNSNFYHEPAFQRCFTIQERRFAGGGIDQFKRRAKQQATSLPYPSLVIMLCPRASCSLFRPLDKTMWAEGVIALDAKTSKDAPALKRPKGMENMTQPTPSMLSSTTDGQFQVAAVTASTPISLFNIAQMAQTRESQIVKLVKDIHSMIQQAIKKAMQPARDKLRDLCATVKVLESDVIDLRKDVATLMGPPSASNPNPPKTAAVISLPEAPKSPLDDWCVGYVSSLEMVSD
ncbi:hypothetical protein HAX54_021237 [Datura stramonium]|uniref:Uncharacterized protein n=1 Tax=Datura stramonium TaxID=4076 RepID=A0ABS8USD4_DATST|nr:hypothetical protein [Datura stramonium]